ncbi:MAG TPA: HAD-IIIC family phosphatase, partial [Steroidobacteraceae bacterium]
MHTIRVIADFTAEPLQSPLLSQLAPMGIEAAVELAPAGQVFQQLLAPDSASKAGAGGGVSVLLVRAEELVPLADRQLPGVSLESETSVVERSVQNFSAALASFQTASANRTLVVLCPSMLELASSPNHVPHALRAIENGIAKQWAQHASISVLVLRDFYVGHTLELFDPQRHAIAQIPFTQRYFAYMARIIAVRLAGMEGIGRKVIVLDADGTLWQGACGEQDPGQIVITASQRRLQELARRARERGVLLALVSKNNPEDVQRVFRENTGMVLTLDDFASLRINWRPKSHNIAEIASELNLAPDSFAMIDDNPLELVEIGSAHPGLLLVPVPAVEAELDAVLDRTWLFGNVSQTEEDARRTQLYNTEQQRKAHQGSFDDLPSFIRSLAIEVTFKRIGPDNLPRAAQMTARTNQFNLCKRVRSQEQLRSLLRADGAHGCIVHVQDRFGDYGLTALVIAARSQDERTLSVDTLLMSCRILGRRVENCILRKLWLVARQLGCTRIRFPLVKSEKNAPVGEFLHEHFAGYEAQRTNSTVDYVVPLDAIAQVAVLESITVRDETVADLDGKDMETNGAVAAQLCQLIQENLELGQAVHTEDSYFSLGGNSLKAVDLVVNAGRQGISLALEDVMTSHTIGELAKLASVESVSASPQPVAPFALLTEGERHFVDERYDLLELDDAFPLSTLQQGMIFHSLQEKSLYENILCWYVECEWNEKAFVKALRTVQLRHPALRSVFAIEADGRALQIVKRSLKFEAQYN